MFFLIFSMQAMKSFSFVKLNTKIIRFIFFSNRFINNFFYTLLRKLLHYTFIADHTIILKNSYIRRISFMSNVTVTSIREERRKNHSIRWMFSLNFSNQFGLRSLTVWNMVSLVWTICIEQITSFKKEKKNG